MAKKDFADESPAQDQSGAAPVSGLLELAKRNGQLFTVNPKLTRFQALDMHESPFKPTHQVADVYHGWRLQWATKHEEVMLSDADYLAALDAAKRGKVHQPANFRTAEHEAKKQASRDAAAKGA